MGDSFEKAQKAALWNGVYPFSFQGFLILGKWAALCSGLKKNVCGLLWALSGEESICDSLMVYMNCCFRILKI